MDNSVEITKKREKANPKTLRRHIFLRGVVQGVGFRPFVYSLARRHALNGWVNNSSDGVHLEVEGDRGAVEQFTVEVSRCAPPRARVESLRFHDLKKSGFRGFDVSLSTLSCPRPKGSAERHARDDNREEKKLFLWESYHPA